MNVISCVMVGRTRYGTSLNCLVNCPKGTMFVDSVDASYYSKTREKLFGLLDKFEKKISVENVVQVMKDNASSNILAGKILDLEVR